MPSSLRDDHVVEEVVVKKNWRPDSIPKGAIELSIMGSVVPSLGRAWGEVAGVNGDDDGTRSSMVARLRAELVDYMNANLPQWRDDICLVEEKVIHVTTRVMYIIWIIPREAR